MNKSLPLVLAIDGGTEAVKAALFDATGRRHAFASRPYHTYYPQSGWAEQDPLEWWTCLVDSVQECLSKLDQHAYSIAAIAADATTCTLVPMRLDGETIGPALLWMDVRAAEQAKKIDQSRHESLRSCSTGINAEWMPPKALWLKSQRPELYQQTEILLEYTDWIAYQLTGLFSLNINTITQRWLYDETRGGWPIAFYEAIGLGDVERKFPDRVCAVGEVIGPLTRKAAVALGLTEGIPICAGGGDAFIGMLGQGVVEPVDMGLITGSSNVLAGLSAEELHIPGIFGSFPNALIPGMHLLEAGQVSTGSILSWFRRNFAVELTEKASASGVSPYAMLDQEAASASVGSDGLIALDYFQGNRSPHTDALARGMMWGLSLQHSRGHLFRALMEGIAYGLRDIVDTLGKHNFAPSRLIVSGGATHSELFMQIYADVLGLPLHVTAEPEASLMGSAVAAMVGVNLHASLAQASRSMVVIGKRCNPDASRHQEYEYSFEKYRETYQAMKRLMQDMTEHHQQTHTIPTTL